MPTKIFWIKNFENGARLGIMARPRGNEWLEDEIEAFKKQKVHFLVSLLESTEIDELGLRREEEICRKQGIDFANFPITDRDIPTNENRTDVFIKSLSINIDEGRSVVIHCRMGIGRSSIIAGSLLVLKGYKTDAIIQQISSLRGLKVPDTQDQVVWLKKREKITRQK